MFIPDKIARKKCKISYKSLVDDAAEDVGGMQIDVKKPAMRKLSSTSLGKRKEVDCANTKAA